MEQQMQAGGVDTNSQLIITKHAIRRAKERLNWDKKKLTEAALLAFINGVPPIEVGYKRKHSAGSMVYGTNIFFFNGRKLLTLYQITRTVKRHLQSLQTA